MKKKSNMLVDKGFLLNVVHTVAMHSLNRIKSV